MLNIMLTNLIIFICIIHQISGQLVIRACCGGDEGICNTYDTIDDLFGIACCGRTPYKSYTQICCNGVIRERLRGGFYADQCCGNDVLRYDQTCCNETAHNMINGDCCGSAVYSRSDPTFLCCDNSLTRTTSPTDVCCGALAFDGGRRQICCGGKVSNREQADACCVLNNGTVVEYLSRTQFCCDGAISKGTGQGCCYMRINDELRAVPYNTDRECCRYPYDVIYPKVDRSCVDDT